MSETGGSLRRYLLDENVARSVAVMLAQHGRGVLESRDVVGPQAADRVVEFAAAEHGLTLVSHDRDFRAIKREGRNRAVRRSSPTVWLRIPEHRASERFAGCLAMVEEILDHATRQGWDIEYVQITADEINVKYRNTVSRIETPRP